MLADERDRDRVRRPGLIHAGRRRSESDVRADHTVDRRVTRGAVVALLSRRAVEVHATAAAVVRTRVERCRLVKAAQHEQEAESHHGPTSVVGVQLAAAV